jgi:hypothetical protein
VRTDSNDLTTGIAFAHVSDVFLQPSWIFLFKDQKHVVVQAIEEVDLKVIGLLCQDGLSYQSRAL